jgi:hypothetical protein
MKSGWTGLPSRMVEKWSCTAKPTAIADYAVCTPILQIAKLRRAAPFFLPPAPLRPNGPASRNASDRDVAISARGLLYRSRGERI